jgi:UDP-glucose 4-epimerase
MKIVVTGAVGHIGSYLIRDLPIQFPGCEIILIDNLITQRFPSLFNLPKFVNYRFIECDIREIDLRPVLKDAHVLIHLAAITDAAGSFTNKELLEAWKLVRRLILDLLPYPPQVYTEHKAT